MKLIRSEWISKEQRQHFWWNSKYDIWSKKNKLERNLWNINGWHLAYFKQHSERQIKWRLIHLDAFVNKKKRYFQIHRIISDLYSIVNIICLFQSSAFPIILLKMSTSIEKKRLHKYSQCFICQNFCSLSIIYHLFYNKLSQQAYLIPYMLHWSLSLS